MSIENFLLQLQINTIIYTKDRANLSCNTTTPSKQTGRKRIDYSNELSCIKITLDNGRFIYNYYINNDSVCK
jgi:hypothetical protein